MGQDVKFLLLLPQDYCKYLPAHLYWFSVIKKGSSTDTFVSLNIAEKVKIRIDF